MITLATFFRDAQRRSAWADYRALLIYAIEQSNAHLLERFV